MKLTNEDKALLREWGFPESDFRQIEEVASRSNCIYEMDGIRISREEAITRLGRENFLSGISRCAFHFTAARETPDGKDILFDASRHLLK